MGELDFLATTIAAMKGGDVKALVESAAEAISSSGVDMNLVREALAAGVAIGRADALDADIPRQAENFLQMMSSQVSSPRAFRILREQLGLSQTDVGNACGVSHTAISDWESGAAPMPASAIGALVKLIKDKQFPTVSAEDISGSDLRSLRRALKINQKEFAERLGVHMVTLSLWEKKAEKKLVGAAVTRARSRFAELRAQAATSPA